MKAHVLTVAVLLALAACGLRADPDTAVADAQKLIAQGKASEARILLKNALSKQAQLPGARVMLAQLALAEGDAKAATDELSALGSTAGESVDVLAIRARAALALGRLDEADEFLRRAGDGLAEPDRSLLRAQLSRSRGASGEALQALRRLQSAYPDDPRVVVETSRTLASLGNLSAALAELDRFLGNGRAPSADALRERADLRMRQGDTTNAIKDIDAALKAAPADWPLVDRIGAELMRVQSMIAAGSVREARTELERIDKTWPGSLGGAVLWAQIALFEGRPSEAADRLSPLVDAVPGDQRLQALLIDALARSGNLVRAIELLEQRVASDPTNLASREQLARLMLQQGRPDRVIELLGGDDETRLGGMPNDIAELLAGARVAQTSAAAAIEQLSGQLRTNPDDANLRAQLAAAQLAKGDARLALETLGAAGARAPSPLAAATRLAALLALGNDFESNRFVNSLLDTTAGASVDTLLAAGDAALLRGNATTASRLLDRASQIDATNAEVMLRRASLAYDAKRFDDADKLLRAIPANSPSAVSAQVALARVAEARGDLDSARAALRAAIKARSPAGDALLMLAGLELRANRTAEMNRVLDELAASTPDGAGANAAGALLARNNRFEEARTRFRQALERAPDNAEYLSNLGQTQLALGDREAARDSLIRSVSLAPGNLAIAQMAVRLSLELKDVANARALADALLKALPNSAGASFTAGQVALAEGNADRARTAFAKSYALQPSALAARGEFAARIVQRSVRADEPLVTWLARRPGDLAVRRILADHLLSSGQTAAARQQLETILKQAPNDAGALNNLAWLLRSSDAEQAERLARQALAIAPGSPAIADTLGTILLANRKASEAVAVLEKAASTVADGSISLHYAQSLQAVGRRADALVAVQKSLAGTGPFAERDSAKKLLEDLKK